MVEPVRVSHESSELESLMSRIVIGIAIAIGVVQLASATSSYLNDLRTEVRLKRQVNVDLRLP